MLPVALDDIIERLESTYSVLEWQYQNLPEYEEATSSLPWESVGHIANVNKIFLDECGLTHFCDASARFLTDLNSVAKQ